MDLLIAVGELRVVRTKGRQALQGVDGLRQTPRPVFLFVSRQGDATKEEVFARLVGLHTKGVEPVGHGYKHIGEVSIRARRRFGAVRKYQMR